MSTPAPGVWNIDPAHTTVGFSVRHLGFSKVRGVFNEFEGTVTVGEDPTDSKVEVTIQAASFDSGVADRDAHIRSADFLDVDNQPTLTFVGSDVKPAGDDRYVVTGDLTIRGTTRTVELDVAYLGVGADPYGNEKAGFEATTEINREDFGLTWNAALESGGLLLGKQVTIELDVQLVKA